MFDKPRMVSLFVSSRDRLINSIKHEHPCKILSMHLKPFWQVHSWDLNNVGALV